MLLSQAKLPLGQGPLEILDSWENVLGGGGAGGARPWKGASQVIRRFSKASLGSGDSERRPLGTWDFLDPSHQLSLGYSPQHGRFGVCLFWLFFDQIFWHRAHCLLLPWQP